MNSCEEKSVAPKYEMQANESRSWKPGFVDVIIISFTLLGISSLSSF